MMLVKEGLHVKSAVPHQGGESYARSVIGELLKRAKADNNYAAILKERFQFTRKEDGLSRELILHAKEVGLIPADFPWLPKYHPTVEPTIFPALRPEVLT